MNWFFRIVWALPFVLLAAGCVEADKPESSAITLAILIDPDMGGAWKAVVERFEKENPGIKVELKEGPTATDERENMYTTSFLARDGVYDLVFMDIIWVPKFASQGFLAPLDDLFPESEREKFLASDIKGSIFEGKIYRVPLLSDVGLLYCRKDILEKAGVDPPRTFSELVAASKKLQQEPELWGYVFQGKQYEGLVCDFLEVLWGHGGDVLDRSGRVVIDSPRAVEALTWLVKIVREDKICPPGVTTYEEEESRHVFQAGRSVFMRNWPYVWGLAQKEDSPIRGKIGIIPMVHAEGHKSAATLGGWGLGISSFSNKQEAAWKFIAFATSYESQKVFHFQRGWIPTRGQLFQDRDILARSAYYTELYKILQLARPRPVHPRYPEISDLMQLHLSSALVGKETPQAAIRKMAEGIRGIVHGQ